MRPLTYSHPSDVATPEPPQTRSRRREEVPDHFKWNLAQMAKQDASLTKSHSIEEAEVRHKRKASFPYAAWPVLLPP